MPRLQLVVPCYNEAERLHSDAFVQFAASPDVGLLLVDDGSTDATPAMLAEIAGRGGANVSVLSLARNAGKAEAVRQGIVAALEKQPELVGYWDADLSTPLDAVPEFIQVLDANPQLEIVIGARVKLLGRRIERYAIRHYSGRAFATAASMALRVAVYDTQCGAKVFRATPAVRKAFGVPFRSKWIFDVEILSRYIASVGAASAESRICELPLQTWTDVPGSKLTVWHALRAAWDLARIWRRPD